jgi:hypothetical protein
VAGVEVDKVLSPAAQVLIGSAVQVEFVAVEALREGERVPVAGDNVFREEERVPVEIVD